MLHGPTELFQPTGSATNMMRSEYVWAMSIATFLAVVLIYILGVYLLKAARPIWGRGKEAHLVVDRRRSKRFEVSLPVFVYGHQSDAEPFFEDTTVLQVSAHGGLLTLASNVRMGQELLLATNGAQELHQPCLVARLGSSKGFRTEVAVRFVRPAPEFWLTQAKQS